MTESVKRRRSLSDVPDDLIGWGLFFLAFGVLFASEAAVGFVRDESVYFEAAERYAKWYRLLFANPSFALTDTAIVQAFDFNHEHPVLMKVLFGLSHLFFHEALGWVRSATAFRIPALLVASLIPMGSFRLGAALFGRAAGLFAAFAWLLVPRQLFNSQLSAFDVPVAAFWLWTVYAFWRNQQDGRWWWTGIAFGVALASKHNAFFLPLVLAPFALWLAFAGARETPAARRNIHGFLAVIGGAGLLYGLLVLFYGPTRFLERFLLLSPHTLVYAATMAGTAWFLFPLRKTAPKVFRALAPLWAIAGIGLLILYVSWPYLWHHPVDRAAWWMAFHAQHNHYTWFYLGELLREPPFPLAYVVVKTALTVPAGIFVPMVFGLCWLLARAVAALAPTKIRLAPATWPEVLVLANALVSIAIISHPNVPHFGGVKHWFPSMPFLAILAGVSVQRAGRLLEERLLPRVSGGIVTTGLAALLFSSAVIASVRIHPYGTSFYGELAGGLPGAASLGMQRQFWSNNVTGVLPWLNEHAPRGARIYLHEVNGYSFRDYQRNGMLRSDLRPAGGPGDAHFAAYQYHQEFREHELNIWQAFGTTTPVFGLYVDETPQVVVYRRQPGGASEGGTR